MMTCACVIQLTAMALVVNVKNEHARSVTAGDALLEIKADAKLTVANALQSEVLDAWEPDEVWGVLMVTNTSVPFTTAKLTAGFMLLLAVPATDTLNCEFAASLVTNEIFASLFVSILTLMTVKALDDDPENSCSPATDLEKGVQLAWESLAANIIARRNKGTSLMTKVVIW